MPHASRYLTAAALLAALLMIGLGCEGFQHLVGSAVPPGDADAQPIEPRTYPTDMPVGLAYDIEVIRTGRRQIKLDNRTAVPYENVTLWLNQQYGATIDQIPIGPSISIPLTEFVNEHGEPFPVGSFLSPEKSRAVVSATLASEDTMHPLSIRLAEDWREQ